MLLLASGACSASSIPLPVITLPSAPPLPVIGAREASAAIVETTPSAEATPAPEPLLDAWSLAAKEDGDACRAELKSAGFRFQTLPDRKEPDKAGCGIPHAVIVTRGPTGIAYDPPIMVDCTMARALSSVETIVQEEAEAHLRSKIVKIGNLGAFACRPRNYKKGASLSAHAFGSAVDVASFHPAKGTPAVILRDYPESARSTPAQDDRRRFLRQVFVRLRREADLTYAVGPDFNAIHHNHFHLDRGGWHFWFNR